jgi:formylglycine-generating enzyme required for sulfatase activity
MATPTNKQLREFILASFNESELYSFCFDYFEGVEHHFSDGMNMHKKVIELISYCNRHQITENLLVALEQERPQPYRTAFALQQPERPTRPRLYRPQPRNPQQVFVSHASEDTVLAHQIAHDLEINGYDIFITPESIRPGEKWVPAINRGLEESGIFIVLLTPDAIQSDWVHDETNTAIALANANEMRLLMLDVQPCHPPILWRQRQFVSFRGNNYAHNLANLQQALAGKVLQPHPSIEVVSPAPEKPAPTPKPADNSFIHEKTGLEFIRIPAGEFLYGEDKKHIHLPDYWISKTPVTQAVYQRFITANPFYGLPDGWNKLKRTFPTDKTGDHPIIYVSWYDAMAFCKWAGLQLPTEQQWEKAARGTDGRTYPWGNNEPTDKLCNFNNNVRGTMPVGHYSPQGDSPYGCVDMSGNVWERCLNKYDEPEDITIDQSGKWRVVRGCSWYRSQDFARAAVRNHHHPGPRYNNLGFRLVRRSPSH